jgi:hypothetical protein
MKIASFSEIWNRGQRSRLPSARLFAAPAAAHQNQGTTSRDDDTNGTFCLLEFQGCSFLGGIRDITKQSGGQVKMAGFSQFCPKRSTEIHRILIGYF